MQDDLVDTPPRDTSHRVSRKKGMVFHTKKSPLALPTNLHISPSSVTGLISLPTTSNTLASGYPYGSPMNPLHKNSSSGLLNKSPRILNQWRCHSCTLYNDEENTICSICDSPRKSIAQENSFSSTSLPKSACNIQINTDNHPSNEESEISCSKCTFKNCIGSTNCEMCDQPLARKITRSQKQLLQSVSNRKRVSDQDILVKDPVNLKRHRQTRIECCGNEIPRNLSPVTVAPCFDGGDTNDDVNNSVSMGTQAPIHNEEGFIELSSINKGSNLLDNVTAPLPTIDVMDPPFIDNEDGQNCRGAWSPLPSSSSSEDEENAAAYGNDKMRRNSLNFEVRNVVAERKEKEKLNMIDLTSSRSGDRERVTETMELIANSETDLSDTESDTELNEHDIVRRAERSSTRRINQQQTIDISDDSDSWDYEESSDDDQRNRGNAIGAYGVRKPTRQYLEIPEYDGKIKELML